MLYLDLALNDDDFLTYQEKNSTSFIRKMKIFVRKHVIKIFDYEIDGKMILVLSKINNQFVETKLCAIMHRVLLFFIEISYKKIFIIGVDKTKKMYYCIM